jgi:hypothetical protein
LKLIREELLGAFVLIFLAVASAAQDKQPGACRSTPPPTSSPPTLVVQVVDPVWLPLPGASVSISAKGRLQNCRAYTDSEGNARFWLARNTEYVAEAELAGFKKRRVKHMFIFKGSDSFPTAYVQIKLELAGRAITVQ